MAIEFTIESPDIEKFAENMKGFPQEAAKALNIGIRKSLLLLEREAKIRTPVATGELRRGYKISLSGLRGRLVNKVKHGIFVHEGTAPHEILPIKKKALWWKGAAHPVKRVFHPGTPANPFFEDAIRAKESDMLKIIKREMDKALKKVAVK